MRAVLLIFFIEHTQGDNSRWNQTGWNSMKNNNIDKLGKSYRCCLLANPSMATHRGSAVFAHVEGPSIRRSVILHRIWKAPVYGFVESVEMLGLVQSGDRASLNVSRSTRPDLSRSLLVWAKDESSVSVTTWTYSAPLAKQRTDP